MATHTATFKQKTKNQRNSEENQFFEDISLRQILLKFLRRAHRVIFNLRELNLYRKLGGFITCDCLISGQLAPSTKPGTILAC